MKKNHNNTAKSAGPRRNLLARSLGPRSDNVLPVKMPKLAVESEFQAASQHHSAGRLEEAIAQYREALRLDPGAAEVHYQLALALKSAGRTPEAEGQFEEAARLGGRP